MSEADSIKRGLWRLGLLLTCDHAGATAAVAQVLATQENVLKLGAERRRRIVINSARAWAAPLGGGEADLPTGPRAAWTALASLEPRQREAWVLREVEGIGEIEATRLLGVAKGPLAAMVSEGAAALRQKLGGAYEGAPGALREASRSEASGAPGASGIAEAEGRLRAVRVRKRVVALVQVLVVLTLMGVIWWVGIDLGRANDREKDVKALQDQLSAPMTDEEAKRAKEQREKEQRDAERGQGLGGRSLPAGPGGTK